MKTFAVVIPTFQEEDYIGGILGDLSFQTLKPLEVIVADAHSKDRTREIILAHGARVVDGGMPGPGRNAGAAHTKADIIFFMDADIRVFDHHFFEKAMKEFDDRKLTGASVNLVPMSNSGFVHFGHNVYNWIIRRLAHTPKPHAAGMCIIADRAAHEHMKGFDPKIIFAEDQDYVERLSHEGKFDILDSVEVSVSLRRFERDGYFITIMKYILAMLHHWFIGSIRHNKFKYEFGYDHLKKK